MTVKVLASRAGDWCNSEGKPMDNYVLTPIKYIGTTSSLDHIEALIAERAPKDTEIIADYNPNFSVVEHSSVFLPDTIHVYATATALVPRKKAEETKDGDREQ